MSSRGRNARPATASLIWTCVLLAVSVVAVGVLGVSGVRTVTVSANRTTRDELHTAQLTAQLGRHLDDAYATGQLLLFDPDHSRRARTAATLDDRSIPDVEIGLAGLVRLHDADPADERADVERLGTEWTSVRHLLNAAAVTTGPDPALAGRLTLAFDPLIGHIDDLITREEDAATAGQDHAAHTAAVLTRTIAAAVALTLLVAAGCARVGTRRIRRAMEPARAQVEFADTLQLAENEDEAHDLLQRHLHHSVTDSQAMILNRNNSADRLEAMTPLPDSSPLAANLRHAQPRSCLAVRSGRTHDEDWPRTALLGCPVCTSCPGTSTCTPLTVGGEVIGSVLLQRGQGFDTTERDLIRDSVGQAAPVLANLRNLALAELRAATDSLTGLPNKRAVGDTLKRMIAQASRTFTPLALLSLDLDHFKAINDTYGHPVGDQALAGVGSALRATIRESDFAGRNGGEEFLVALPDTDLVGATTTAEKIRAAIAEITLPGMGVSVTASVGIAVYPDHATNAQHLERLADSALYLAKHSGRNRVEIAVAATSTGVDEPPDHPPVTAPVTATATATATRPGVPADRST